MTRNRLKVVSKPSDHPVCHFMPFLALFESPQSPKLSNLKIITTIYNMHTMVGVNSYVFDDGKSMKSGFKFF